MRLAPAALAISAVLGLAAAPDGGHALDDADEAAQDWRQAMSVFPDLAAETPAEGRLSPLPSLLEWARPGKTIEVVDRQCRPLRLTRTEDVLLGKVNVETRVEGGTKSVHFEELVVGESAMVTCGVTETFERVEGRWVPAGTGATGCANQVDSLLSRVTADAVWYQGVEVSLTPRCAHRIEEAARCQGQDGGIRSCTRCERWELDERVLTGGMGASAGATTVIHEQAFEAVDCSQPCPPDPDLAHLRAAQSLRGRRFERSLEGHPLLFRTATACERYWASRPASAEERASPW